MHKTIVLGEQTLAGELSLASFADGTPLLVFASDGEPNERFSVNLAGHGVSTPEGCVWVPDYSEHDGLPDALVEAGVGEITDTFVAAPYGAGYKLLRLNADLVDPWVSYTAASGCKRLIRKSDADSGNWTNGSTHDWENCACPSGAKHNPDDWY